MRELRLHCRAVHSDAECTNQRLDNNYDSRLHAVWCGGCCWRIKPKYQRMWALEFWWLYSITLADVIELSLCVIMQLFGNNFRVPTCLRHPRRCMSLHCALAAAQCIVIGPVSGCVCVSVTTITRNCVHRSSPNWVCR